MNNTHDNNGRAYAKLSELRDGDKIELDGSFTCIEDYPVYFINKDERGLYFLCNEGLHYLAGQADDGEHCVGVYKL